jgi:HEAT repeat protein
MRELEAEADFWQELYLSALGKIYDALDADAAKGQFLAESLVNSNDKVRLWALEKISQWRVGTKSKLPAELGSILVGLISDKNRDVRLKTAKLLSLMGELNSAQNLLEQHKVELDDEVRMELFVALGGACHYAFSPNSGINIPEEVRKQTLEWAEEYLAEQDTDKARKGAEVIKKLLEQDGLFPDDVTKYLGLLAERYKQEKGKADGNLRGELLGAMAGLCAQSVYKAESAMLFETLFEDALNDPADLVREAAVDGLAYIDKTKALRILRKDFVNDGSVIVRNKVVDLAGEVGSKEDLVWLVEKIGATAESEPAWQAMLKIFKRSDTAVLKEWLKRFESQSTKAKLSDEQMLSFLEIAERKAQGEDEMLKAILSRLAEIYKKTGEFEQAAKYLGLLLEGVQQADERDIIIAELLDVYLGGGNLEAGVQLVANSLLEKDLDPNSGIVLSIDGYLTRPAVTSEPNVVLGALADIRTSQPRPKWSEQMIRWAEQFGLVPGLGEPKKAGN